MNLASRLRAVEAALAERLAGPPPPQIVEYVSDWDGALQHRPPGLTVRQGPLIYLNDWRTAEELPADAETLGGFEGER